MGYLNRKGKSPSAGELEIAVFRRRPGEKEGRWQTFLYKPEGKAETVAAALRRLNDREPLLDREGNRAEPVRWECSCLQKKCGACAMVINGRPRLACDARLSEFRGKLRLEPLRKFPVVADLIVDRSALFRELSEMRIWLDGHGREREQGLLPWGEEANGTAYEASRCLQCGCCLEVCPNFSVGEEFAGMAAAVPMARLLSELPPEEQGEPAGIYEKKIYAGCGKSLACRDICPAGIPIDELLARSAAVAVWKRAKRRRGSGAGNTGRNG